MSELDRAVDAALREWVAGEGPPDLRRRVLARLGEAPRRPPVAWPALAAATIALAAATVLLFRTPVAPPLATTSTHRYLSPAAPPRLPPPATVGSLPPAQIARLAIASTWRPKGRSHAPELLVADDVEADTGEIERIEVSPLAVPPMEAQPWAIAPLRIEPMQIEPLAEPQP